MQTLLQDIPLVEPLIVPDTYVTGLARVELLSHGLARFVFFAEQIGAMGKERVIVARHIWSIDAVPAAIRQTATAIGRGRIVCCARLVARH